MQRIITRVKPTAPRVLALKRVAAYARVSCEKDAMLHSLAAQVDFYRKAICNHPEWAFAGVYADVDAPYGRYPKALD